MAISDPYPAGVVSTALAVAPDSGAPRFPADLTYQGGAVAVSMKNHAPYLHPHGGCTIAGCWGTRSSFCTTSSRATSSTWTPAALPITAIRWRRSLQTSTTPPRQTAHGRRHACHHSLSSVKGEQTISAMPLAMATSTTCFCRWTDKCFATTYRVCYSPDNLSSFFFCTYHGSAGFTDIGHVLYSVEPFQDVDMQREARDSQRPAYRFELQRPLARNV
jgi:hypothetical protein